MDKYCKLKRHQVCGFPIYLMSGTINDMKCKSAVIGKIYLYFDSII